MEWRRRVCNCAIHLECKIGNLFDWSFEYVERGKLKVWIDKLHKTPIRKILTGTHLIARFKTRARRVSIAEVCNVLCTHADQTAYVVP